MMEQTKAELRKQYKQKRRALTPEQVTVASAHQEAISEFR